MVPGRQNQAYSASWPAKKAHKLVSVLAYNRLNKPFKSLLSDIYCASRRDYSTEIWWMAKKKESIKYCARKCHNGGPLTKMMANHRKKFCGGAERTIAILSSSWRGQPTSQPPPLLPPPQPAPGQPSLPSLPQSATQPERLLPLSPARIYVKHFINLGAHIMSPTILKLLLTAMTLVSVASEEGKSACYYLHCVYYD